MTTTPTDPLDCAALWHAEGEAVAIATVIRTWGSSPRPPGSRMALTRSGRFAGSVSGGCIETEVMLLAHDVLDTNRPTVTRFEVSSERAWSVGIACGGAVDLLIEPVVADPSVPMQDGGITDRASPAGAA